MAIVKSIFKSENFKLNVKGTKVQLSTVAGYGLAAVGADQFQRTAQEGHRFSLVGEDFNRESLSEVESKMG